MCGFGAVVTPREQGHKFKVTVREKIQSCTYRDVGVMDWYCSVGYHWCLGNTSFCGKLQSLFC